MCHRRPQSCSQGSTKQQRLRPGLYDSYDPGLIVCSSQKQARHTYAHYQRGPATRILLPEIRYQDSAVSVIAIFELRLNEMNVTFTR